MIVDPGAWMTMFGAVLARSLTMAVHAAGHIFRETRLSNPIKIAGVGNGVNHIRHAFQGPIAVPTVGGPARLFDLEAGIVDEPGDGLPGLLGMVVLESRRAILDVERRQLIFPGEVDWEYNLPPGSVITPLSKAQPPVHDPG